jgi:acetyltransferase-like isoleucine patch superfamily enzyme
MIDFVAKNLARHVLNLYRVSLVNSRNKNARISPRAIISGPDYQRVTLGASVSIGDFTVIILESIPNSDLYGPASLTIGDNTYIGEMNNLRINVPTVIGRDCLISQGNSIITTNHSIVADAPVISQPWNVTKMGVVIEDGVWIGANCCILPGVHLGSGCVVAAGSVVTKSFSAFSIIAGVPAQKIGSRE